MQFALLSLAAVLGALSWSLTEYLLHRFRGHQAKTPNLFQKEHLMHHARHGYFSSNRLKATMATPPILGLAALASLLVGPALGGTFAVAFAVTYCSYELVHRRIHTHPPTGPYSRAVRRHHLAHHFADGMANYGVTSPAWDWVFGTRKTVERLEVPHRYIPVWLADGEGLRADFAQDYVLKPTRRERAA